MKANTRMLSIIATVLIIILLISHILSNRLKQDVQETSAMNLQFKKDNGYYDLQLIKQRVANGLPKSFVDASLGAPFKYRQDEHGAQSEHLLQYNSMHKTSVHISYKQVGGQYCVDILYIPLLQLNEE